MSTGVITVLSFAMIDFKVFHNPSESYFYYMGFHSGMPPRLVILASTCNTCADPHFPKGFEGKDLFKMSWKTGRF